MKKLLDYGDTHRMLLYCFRHSQVIWVVYLQLHFIQVVIIEDGIDMKDCTVVL